MEKIYKREKIALFFGSLHKGGTENTICNLANTISNNGDIVHIILLQGSNIEYRLDPSVKVIDLNAKDTTALSRIAKVRTLIKKEEYDAIAAFSSKILLYLFLSNPIRRYRLVGFERSNPFMAVDGLKGKIIKKILSNWTDGYVFQTEGAKSFYNNKVQKKSVVIQNGLLGGIVKSPVISFEKRNKFKIVSVGRLQPGKGFDCSIRAFSEFCKKLPEYKYYIYGEGPERKRLESLIRDLDMESNIFLEGQVDNVFENIIDAACFLFPSRHEGMPNALLEAMACGIPCVSSNCKFGPSEIIKTGENGILVDVDDINGFINALEALKSDSTLAKRISEEAQKVRITNNWDRISEQYIHFIING